MSKLRSACIEVDKPEQVSDFYAWLERNASHIIGISANNGCGCCVDSYHLEVSEEAEEMPCASYDDKPHHDLVYGVEKERMIDEILGLH